MMQSLGRRYVRHINDSCRRTGTLWEGRYRAAPIDSGAWLFACCRYIDLNPVRAGIVRDTARYPWSSHRALADGAVGGILSPHALYLALGADGAARQAGYCDLSAPPSTPPGSTSCVPRRTAVGLSVPSASNARSPKPPAVAPRSSRPGASQKRRRRIRQCYSDPDFRRQEKEILLANLALTDVHFGNICIPIMTSEELKAAISTLGLTPADAAEYLNVAPRTFRRWLEGEEVPGPAGAAVEAWLRLAQHKLPWKPHSAEIFELNPEEITRYITHADELAAMFRRVENRGGPTDPWHVDMTNGIATFGPFEVSFYKLVGGGFSLSTYRRRDNPPDWKADRSFIEDAAYAIAVGFAKIPDCAEALRNVAEYAQLNSNKYAVRGTRILAPAAADERRAKIEAIGKTFEQMAAAMRHGETVTYDAFEKQLKELHDLGFFPRSELVSAVARAFLRNSL
jgi:DNA-binding transcriptional regulator YiaG